MKNYYYCACSRSRSLQQVTCGSSWIMAEALQTTLDGTPSGVGEKLRRQCYSREKKLEVIAFYQSHNLYQTARKFSLNTKTVLKHGEQSFLARHLHCLSEVIMSLIERLHPLFREFAYHRRTLPYKHINPYHLAL